MDTTATICWDKTYRQTNPRMKTTRRQVFFLFWLIDHNYLKFRSRDVKIMARGTKRSYLAYLILRGYLSKEGFVYTVTEKAISDKLFFEKEYNKRIRSGNVWQ